MSECGKHVEYEPDSVSAKRFRDGPCVLAVGHAGRCHTGRAFSSTLEDLPFGSAPSTDDLRKRIQHAIIDPCAVDDDLPNLPLPLRQSRAVWSVVAPLLAANEAALDRAHERITYLHEQMTHRGSARLAAERERDKANAKAAEYCRLYQAEVDRVAGLTRERDQLKAHNDSLIELNTAEHDNYDANLDGLTRERDQLLALLNEELAWLKERRDPDRAEVARAIGFEDAVRTVRQAFEAGRPAAQEAPAPLDGRPADVDDYGQDYEAQAHAHGLPEPGEAGEPPAPRAAQLREAMDRWSADGGIPAGRYRVHAEIGIERHEGYQVLVPGEVEHGVKVGGLLNLGLVLLESLTEVVSGVPSEGGGTDA